jgi:hypothetical protein
MADTAARRAPGLQLLFTLVFALIGWDLGIGRLGDNSFFWHLRTGELILDHGIPHTDPYSFTAHGTTWVAQSWLAELLYGALDRSFGAFSIRVLGGVLGILIAILAFRLALRKCRDRVRATLLTLVALGGVYTLWSERPLLFGLLFLLVLLWIVEVPDSIVGRHPFVSLPILFWLWANVHGTFALGFLYLLLHLLGRWLDGSRPWEGRERQLAIGALIAFAVIFVNPYGAALVTFPIQLLGRGDILNHVVEWRSPDFRQKFGFVYAVWIVVMIVAFSRGAHRVSRRDLLVSIPFLLLGFWALRNVGIAPLVMLPIAAAALSVDEERRDDRHAIGWALAAIVVVVAVGLGAQAAGKPDFAFGDEPVRAMHSIEQQRLLGRRIFNDDGWGGYIILKYWPRQHVFFDDRFDMYPRTVIQDYFDISGATARWERLLDRYDVDTVVWRKGSPLAVLLAASPHWRRIHTDKLAVVYVRVQSPKR